MKTINYIGNAKIIKLSELPHIGEAHEIIKSLICIESKIIDFKDDFIIYDLVFCEKESLNILDDFFVDCCRWSYAINKKDFSRNKRKWKKLKSRKKAAFG